MKLYSATLYCGSLCPIPFRTPRLLAGSLLDIGPGGGAFVATRYSPLLLHPPVSHTLRRSIDAWIQGSAAIVISDDQGEANKLHAFDQNDLT